MIDGSELIDTSRYQSLFQLGTAVALAYLVAGPELWKIIRPQIDLLFGFRNKLARFQAEGRPGNIAARSELAALANALLSTERYRANKVNLATTTLHFLLALGCFAFLLYSSVYTHMTSGWVLIGCLNVGCAIFMDPLLVILDAWRLKKLLDLVWEIGNVQTHRDPDGQMVHDASVAIRNVVMEKQSLKRTLKTLQATKLRTTAR